MPGAVQSQDLAIVGFGTVGSYFLVTGTTLLGTASSPCVVASLPNATQNMRRGYTQPASSLSAQSLSRLKPCRRMRGFSSVFRSGQAWPLLICAGIFKNGAAAVSARHGVTQSLMQVGRNVLMALQCAATKKPVLPKVQAWHNLTSQCRHRAKRHGPDLLVHIELANAVSSVLPGAAWCFAHGSEPCQLGLAGNSEKFFQASSSQREVADGQEPRLNACCRCGTAAAALAEALENDSSRHPWLATACCVARLVDPGSQMCNMLSKAFAQMGPLLSARSCTRLAASFLPHTCVDVMLLVGSAAWREA